MEKYTYENDTPSNEDSCGEENKDSCDIILSLENEVDKYFKLLHVMWEEMNRCPNINVTYKDFSKYVISRSHILSKIGKSLNHLHQN